MKIQVRDYNFKSKPGQNETGFIAQQLYTVLPDVVSQGGEDPAKKPWTVDYGRVTPLLTKAIQEQQGEIETLKAENVRLQAENARWRGQTDKLGAKMEALEKTRAAKQTKHRSAVHGVALNK
jgi:FtsZ-binding cell division protein ZapB